MATTARCGHCGSVKLAITEQRNILRCEKCGALTDMRNPWLRIAGSAVAGVAGALTLGLLPEEATEALGEAFTDLLEG